MSIEGQNLDGCPLEVRKLSEVKTFRVKCTVKFGFRKLTVFKEVRALKVEEALEKFCSEIGSNYKLKRCQLKNIVIEEIRPEQAKNPVIRMLAGVEEAK